MVEGDNTILLNLDYTFLATICWKKAVKLLLLKKADIVIASNRIIRSTNQLIISIPKVIRLLKLVKVKFTRRKAKLTKLNIMIRDGFKCVYCSSGSNLTIDHVIPVSRGGRTIFENVVTCCYSCNEKKGNKTPEEAHMKLRKIPYAPTRNELVALQTRHIFRKTSYLLQEEEEKDKHEHLSRARSM
jgi:5-methylcytosine-specific restriction endonuclease McrA